MRPIVENSLRDKRILLIDCQNAWRRRSAQGLRDAGAHVTEWDRYIFPPLISESSSSSKSAPQFDQQFDLVILGCPSVRREEQKLISKILEQGYRLLVLPASLPWLTMRSVFRTGVDDVTDKPYDSDKLINVVSQALEAIQLRDQYQAFAKGVLQ